MSVGVLVGRFQPFHNGHLAAVKHALGKVDYLYVVVGSSQKSHERDNPFTASERIGMMKAALDGAGVPASRWMAIPLADTVSHSVWPATLKTTVPKFDVVFTNDSLTTRLLKEQGMKVYPVPYLKRDKYSGTNVRSGILEMKDWEKLVPKEVATMVKQVRGVERVKSMVHKDLQGD